MVVLLAIKGAVFFGVCFQGPLLAASIVVLWPGSMDDKVCFSDAQHDGIICMRPVNSLVALAPLQC
jgi:hypothetical protein